MSASQVPTREAGPLPVGLRNTAIACLVLVGGVGLLSASEAASLTNLAAVREAPARGTSFFADPALVEKAQTAQLAAYVSAVEPMQTSRGLVLGALAIACSLAFVSALRLLRPGGLPRESMRGVLGGAALAAAMLRAIDGAQAAVVARKVGLAAARVLLDAEPYRSDPATYRALPDWVAAFITGISVAQTAVVAGGLLVLSLYFRSEKVRQIVAFRDGQAG